MVYVGLSESKLSGTIRYENITVEQFDRMRIELAKIFGEDGVKVTDKPFRYCKGYAEVIREKRIERGMSIRALARASGVNVTSLTRYQNGTINLTNETLKKVMTALGLTEEDLKGDKIDGEANCNHAGREELDDHGQGEDGGGQQKDI